MIKKPVLRVTPAHSYSLNYALALLSILMAGTFLYKGFAYTSMGFIWGGIIEWLYATLLIIVGKWQSTIFFNKYIYYNYMSNLKKDENEFKNQN